MSDPSLIKHLEQLVNELIELEVKYRSDVNHPRNATNHYRKWGIATGLSYGSSKLQWIIDHHKGIDKD